jgi:hypothetical protein
MQGTSLQSLINIGPVVSEEMSFEGNGGRTDGRTYVLTYGYLCGYSIVLSIVLLAT